MTAYQLSDMRVLGQVFDMGIDDFSGVGLPNPAVKEEI